MESKSPQLYYAAFLIVFAICLCLSWPSALQMSDDLYYGNICSGESIFSIDEAKTPMTSLSELIPSQAHHYMTVNGRFIAHTLVQLFVNFLGYPALQIVNALLVCGIIILIARLADFDNREKLMSLCVGVFFFFLLMPLYTIGAFFSIAAGIFNYSLAAFAMLLGLYKFKKYRQEGQRKVCAIKAIGIFLLGVFCGGIQEGFCVPLGVSFFCSFLYCIIKRRRHGGEMPVRNTRMILLTVGVWVGNLSLLVSPGSWSRMGSGEGMSLMTMIVLRIRGPLYLIDAFVPLIILIIALIALSYVSHKKYKSALRRFLARYSLEIIIGIVNIMFCMAAGLFQFTRIFIPLGLMLAIMFSALVISCLKRIDSHKLVRKSVLASMCVFSLMMSGVLMVNGVKNRAAYEDVVKRYSESPDGVVYLPDYVDYKSEKLVNNKLTIGPKHPNPWQRNDGATWNVRTVRYFYSDDFKPMIFSPTQSSLAKAEVIYNDSNVTARTLRDAWWIEMEVSKRAVTDTLRMVGNGQMVVNPVVDLYSSSKPSLRSRDYDFDYYELPDNGGDARRIIVSKYDNFRLNSLKVYSGERKLAEVESEMLR